jgi:hypothetical protein
VVFGLRRGSFTFSLKNVAMRSSPPILPFLGDTARGFCGGFPEAEPRGIKAMVIATAMPIGDIRMELPRLPRRLCPRSSSLPASCSWMFLRPRQRAADLLIGRPRNETSIAPTLCQADASPTSAVSGVRVSVFKDLRSKFGTTFGVRR